MDGKSNHTTQETVNTQIFFKKYIRNLTTQKSFTAHNQYAKASKTIQQINKISHKLKTYCHLHFYCPVWRPVSFR